MVLISMSICKYCTSVSKFKFKILEYTDAAGMTLSTQKTDVNLLVDVLHAKQKSKLFNMGNKVYKKKGK